MLNAVDNNSNGKICGADSTAERFLKAAEPGERRRFRVRVHVLLRASASCRTSSLPRDLHIVAQPCSGLFHGVRGSLRRRLPCAVCCSCQIRGSFDLRRPQIRPSSFISGLLQWILSPGRGLSTQGLPFLQSCGLPTGRARCSALYDSGSPSDLHPDAE